MRATRLTIKNFRNLGSVSVPLGPGTVVVGENGAGKSNLMHALRLVLDPTLSWQQRVLRREDFWDGLADETPEWDPFVAGAVIEIAVDIEDIEQEPAVLAALGLAVSETEPLTARLAYRFEPRTDIEQADGAAKVYDWGIYGGTGDERIGSDLRKFLAHVHLGALRDVEGDLASLRRSPLHALIDEVSEQADADELAAVAAALDEAHATLSALEPVTALGTEIAAETEALAGARNALPTVLGLTPAEPLRILRSLRLFLDETTRRPLSAASLGALNILYLALVELRLARELKTGVIAHALLTIEEPEAHLHPHTQRTVFSRLLRESESRTALVTTHSPHIVSVTPPQQLVVLHEVDGVVVASDAAAATLEPREWDDIARYLDATRGELVFARRVLLVEGFAEQVIIPEIARALGHDLDRLGISVCAIHGTHFDVYARFLTALGIPWAVITDGDSGGGAARAQRILTALGRAGEDGAAAGIFVGSVTFEHDLYAASDANARACRAALAELMPSVSADSELSADEFLAKAASRKGRFAQRLAPAAAALDAPGYIAEAVARLVTP